MKQLGSVAALLIAIASLCSSAFAAMAPGPTSAAIRDGTFLTADGARIHYLEAGIAGHAPALVLIPGWTLTTSLWREQLEHFSGARLVLAIDSRSQADSSKMQTGNTPEQRARDLHDLLAQRHVDRFVIVGWSQGAQDVAAYVQQFGTASLTGIVFVDSPVSAGTAELDIRKEFSKVILSGLATYANHPREYSEGMVRSIFKRPHPDLDINAVIAQAQKTPPSIGAAMLVADIFGADRRPALKKIDRPTLVIASALSPLLDAQKEMAKDIAQSRLVVVPAVGHALFVDDPPAFDNALDELLRAAPSGQAGTSRK